MFSARMPEDLIRDVNMDSRTNQEIAETALRREVGSHDAKMLEMRADKIQATAESLLAEIEQLQQQRNEKLAQVRRLREQAEDARIEETETVDTYDAILDDLAGSGSERIGTKNLYAYSAEVNTLIDGSDLTKEEIMNELRERYDERDDIELSDPEKQLSFGGGF